MTPEVSAVVVNHRSAAECADCVASLRRAFETEGVAGEIVLVDCASGAEEVARLSGLGADVVVPLAENRGYSGGVNAGLAGARGQRSSAEVAIGRQRGGGEEGPRGDTQQGLQQIPDRIHARDLVGKEFRGRQRARYAEHPGRLGRLQGLRQVHPAHRAGQAYRHSHNSQNQTPAQKSPRTSRGAAPSASRMPISRRRCETAYAMTP